VPLWDPVAAAAEVRRMAARGVTATCFSEIPAFLGLPSIHSGDWDPFFEACNETSMVVNMHIGSSSKMPSTSPDAPPLVGSTMTFTNCMMSMVDFLMSGVLVRFPNVKLAYAEGQLGWIPYILERADKVWHDNRGWGGVGDSVPEPPSTYYYRQMFACFFDDEFGLTEGALAKIGERNILFETDYPHSDSTWPHTKEVATKLMGHLPDETVRRLVRGNAIELYQLDLPA
jgi:predicted TIM-barrel fold metal-dependent hydrolase